MAELYKTRDMNLAATLKLLGYKLHSIDVKGRKGTFNMEDVPEDVVLDYDYGNLRVEPQAFNNEIKALTTSCRRLSESSGYRDVNATNRDGK